MKKENINLHSIKGFDKLNKMFDIVKYQMLDTHQELKIANKVGHSFIEEEVYLNLKIALSSNGGKKPSDCLAGAIDNLLEWSELLLSHDEKPAKQNSLFDDGSTDDELEEIPPQPEKDEEWDSWCRNKEKIKIRNLKKQYKFFDLFNMNNSWWAYHEFNWRKFLPTQDEMISLIKDAILRGKKEEGRFDDYWFESYGLKDGNPLSDVELFSVVMRGLRVFVAPYKVTENVFYDLSYETHGSKPGVKDTYLFYYDYGKLQTWYLDRNINELMPEYEIYSEEFVSFLRKTFNVEYCEPLDDDLVTALTVKHLLKSIRKDWQEVLNSCSSVSELKNKLFANIVIDDIEIKRIYFTEDYDANINLNKKKPYIQIYQRSATRQKLGYLFDKGADESHWKYYISMPEGDEVFRLALELLKTEDRPYDANNGVVQTTLFDFMGAAS